MAPPFFPVDDQTPRGRREEFEDAWRRAAQEGHCDGWGGAECRRRYADWVRVGRPPAGPFIRNG